MSLAATGAAMSLAAPAVLDLGDDATEGLAGVDAGHPTLPAHTHGNRSHLVMGACECASMSPKGAALRRAHSLTRLLLGDALFLVTPAAALGAASALTSMG
jgi:hypothetical protein